MFYLQEEEQGNNEVLIQGHTQSEQKLKRSYEEQLKQAEDDVVWYCMYFLPLDFVTELIWIPSD